MSLPLLSDVAD